MMRQIAATRRARRQRLVLVMTGLMSVLTLVLSGSAWVLTSYVTSSLGRVNAGTSGTPSSGPVNILVAGIDTRGGLTRHQEIELHVGNSISSNSDTLMLVHIPASHDSVQVVSLPRDSWVSIPGHGMNKINAAYGLGGPQLMVQTVEQATGLQINDYVEVDFLGFVKVINALGGVNICVPFAVDDPDSGLDISAGRHHVDGITALEYARDRHSFALSDIQRISDQQQLLSSLFTEATQTGVLANPIRLQEFLSSVTAAVKVDEGFNLVKLAEEMRGIRSSDVTFTTVPLASMNYLTPSGESAVLWNTRQGQRAVHLAEEQHRSRAPGRAQRVGEGPQGQQGQPRQRVRRRLQRHPDQRPVSRHRQPAQRARLPRHQIRAGLVLRHRHPDAHPVPARAGRRGTPAGHRDAGRAAARDGRAAAHSARARSDRARRRRKGRLDRVVGAGPAADRGPGRLPLIRTPLRQQAGERARERPPAGSVRWCPGLALRVPARPGVVGGGEEAGPRVDRRDITPAGRRLAAAGEVRPAALGSRAASPDSRAAGSPAARPVPARPAPAQLVPVRPADRTETTAAAR